MSPLQRLLVSVTAAFVFAVLFANADDIDSNCMGCLCEASTNCNVTVACHVPYQGAYFCGPFQLSWAYWSDAGKPVLQHDHPDKQGAFENCALDLHCAAKTVRQYMHLFSQDCNNDGVEDCDDYVRIHKLGRDGCRGHLRDDDFTAKFRDCSSRLNLH